MKRKWIGMFLAAVMTVLPVGGLAAGREATLTAEDVARLVYTDTMAEHPRAEEMLNLTYMLDNDVESRVRLGDLIVPERSIPLYPYVWRSISNDGYLDEYLREPTADYYQRMQDYVKGKSAQEYYNAIRWLCTSSADESKYYIVDIEEEDGALTIPYLWEGDKIAGPDENTPSLFVDRLSFDFEKMAELINAAALGRIDHILIASGATCIDSEKGDYFIFECPLVNGSARYLGRDEAPGFPAETFIPVNDYIAFANQWYQDRKDANALLKQRIVEKAGYPEAGNNSYNADEEIIIPDTDSLVSYLGQTSKYPDVARLYPGSEGERLQAVLCQLTDRGVLNGKEDGNFDPTDVLRRGEAAAMVGRLFRLVPDSGGSVFSDVTPDYYAAGYIGAMRQMGIINGYEDGTFQPEKAVTYSELFMMVTSLLGGVVDSYGVKDYYPEGANKVAVKKTC